MNRFIEGGRLTDRHKNQLDEKQLLNRLNQIARDLVRPYNDNCKYSRPNDIFKE